MNKKIIVLCSVLCGVSVTGSVFTGSVFALKKEQKPLFDVILGSCKVDLEQIRPKVIALRETSDNLLKEVDHLNVGASIYAANTISGRILPVAGARRAEVDRLVRQVKDAESSFYEKWRLINGLCAEADATFLEAKMAVNTASPDKDFDVIVREAKQKIIQIYDGVQGASKFLASMDDQHRKIEQAVTRLRELEQQVLAEKAAAKVPPVKVPPAKVPPAPAKAHPARVSATI